jgi:hypothetical protein
MNDRGQYGTSQEDQRRQKFQAALKKQQEEEDNEVRQAQKLHDAANIISPPSWRPDGWMYDSNRPVTKEDLEHAQAGGTFGTIVLAATAATIAGIGVFGVVRWLRS